MKLNSEQSVVCRVFSRRDDAGKVHCKECPMTLDADSMMCLKNVSKKDAEYNFSWRGSRYPALGEYEGEKDGTDTE